MNKLKACIKSPPPRPSPPTVSATATATLSFNSTINRLSSNGSHRDVLSTFFSMLRSHTPPDTHTYPCLFKACTYLNRFSLGILLHQRAIVDGSSVDSYISSSLINFYGRFECVENAQKVFDLMSERNVVPWTAMIGCYARGGDVDRAFCMYNLMRFEEVQPSYVTLLNLLSRVNEVTRLECLHGNAVHLGFDSKLNLGNCMLNLYGKFGRVEAARDLFEGMRVRDIVSWNSLVSSYAQDGNFEGTLGILDRMRNEGFNPDQHTYGTVLTSSETLGTNIELGRIIHDEITAGGLAINAHLATSFVGLYSKYGDVSAALEIFERVSEKDAVLWTSMISTFVQNNGSYKALMLFTRMLELNVTPSTATIATVTAACAKLNSLRLGTSVHGYILRQRITEDIQVQNSLVTMYAKCGLVRQSYDIFNSMIERDVVSWNAIVAAYCENGDLWNALFVLNEMRSVLQRPDAITIVSLLQVCASNGALQQGKWIHNFVIKTFTQTSIMVNTGLVNMYSKCGDLETAYKCFNQIPNHDVVSWSTMITGYGSNGQGKIALKLYSDFLYTGIQPNNVLFLAVLFSCSHNGLVSEGLSIFKSMIEEFGIKPELEHLSCMVDLLCRAGRIREAYDFIKNMVSEPTVEVLGILLDACRMKGDAKLGEIVARDIMMLEPTCAGNYVQLAHSYASMNRWEGVHDAWTQMKALGLKKLPGWSYIQEHGKVTTFCKGQTDHPEHGEIMLVLEILCSHMDDPDFELNSIDEHLIIDCS